MKAIWNGQVIAESDRTIEVEGKQYFPRTAVNEEFVVESPSSATHHFKGEARFYTLQVDGAENKNAAWYYPDPEGTAKEVRGMVAFGDNVEVRE